MNHLAKIQREFVREAADWNSLSQEAQKEYLKDHPKSKRRVTAKPAKDTSKLKEKLEEKQQSLDHAIPVSDFSTKTTESGLKFTPKNKLNQFFRDLSSNWDANDANEQFKHLKKQYPNKSKQIDELINTTQSHAKNITKRDNMRGSDPQYNKLNNDVTNSRIQIEKLIEDITGEIPIVPPKKSAPADFESKVDQYIKDQTSGIEGEAGASGVGNFFYEVGDAKPLPKSTFKNLINLANKGDFKQLYKTFNDAFEVPEQQDLQSLAENNDLTPDEANALINHPKFQKFWTETIKDHAQQILNEYDDYKEELSDE